MDDVDKVDDVDKLYSSDLSSFLRKSAAICTLVCGNLSHQP
jgi:hypothetical protein